jgi:large subunit ribosomal protein L24
MSRAKLNVRTGDKVKVLSGKDRGKEGKVLAVNRKHGRALVEGVNLMKKAVRPSETNPEGGISELESTLHVSNLKVVEAASKEDN